MNNNSPNHLMIQWQTLHQDHEKYEQLALGIKIFSVLLCVLSIVSSIATFIIVLLLATLWLQEGIWKTYQARTSSAILSIEQALTEKNQDDEIFSLYAQWQKNRPSAASLITEYLTNSLKPTVLFPYIPLIVITLIN